GGRFSRTRANARRVSRLRSWIRPAWSAKASSKTSFAKSIATVVACMAWTPPVIPLTETASSVWPTRPFGDAGGVHFIIQADTASLHKPYGRYSLPYGLLHYAVRLNLGVRLHVESSC